jgi:hypothetical protein
MSLRLKSAAQGDSTGNISIFKEATQDKCSCILRKTLTFVETTGGRGIQLRQAVVQLYTLESRSR